MSDFINSARQRLDALKRQVQSDLIHQERPAPLPDGAIVQVEDNFGNTRIALVCGVHEEPGSGTLHGGRWYLLSSREGISWTHSSRVKLLTNEEAR